VPGVAKPTLSPAAQRQIDKHRVDIKGLEKIIADAQRQLRDAKSDLNALLARHGLPPET